MTEQELAESAERIISTVTFAHVETRRYALEEAATVCDKHAAFLKYEADHGGAWDYLMRRHEEAVCLAGMIRKLAAKPVMTE
jgi:hypothetical protein